jgi:hypothetical protein
LNTDMTLYINNYLIRGQIGGIFFISNTD